MATESNTGFHDEKTLGSVMNRRHAISFQSGAINSTLEMIPMGSYFGVNTCTAGMILPRNSNFINTTHPGIIQAGNSSGSSLILDSVPGLKHDAGLAVEWSVEEQYKLEQGLEKFKGEPSIMRYIKIAATLRDKTVHDVALRCRWMTRKRRKPEEHNAGKKVNNRKDKLVESSAKANTASALPQNVATYPLMMHHVGQSELMPSEACHETSDMVIFCYLRLPEAGSTDIISGLLKEVMSARLNMPNFSGLSSTAMQLWEQNAQAFTQITANLSTYKLQDNIDLFCQARNNIYAILNDIKNMPGIMSQMPPLLVSINEDLANSLLV